MLKNKITDQQRGDTLIEVLFALTVFAFIVVSALSLMNQGVSASRRALEITTVRQAMDGQAETLRFLHDSYVQAYTSGIKFDTTTDSPAGEYAKILEYAKTGGRTGGSALGGTATTCKVPDEPTKDFVLNPVLATFVKSTTPSFSFQKATTYAQLVFDSASKQQLIESQGIWIEPIHVVPPASPSAGYTDFHIRACWDAPGASIPMTLGTIVRLYEPRG